MKTPNLTDQQIQMFFKEEGAEVLRMLEPLMELSANSSTLVLGYGRVGKPVRSEMLPYFHVCGANNDHEPVRILVIGGWAGGETTSTYAIARMLARVEASFSLATGIEITAYPIANLVAHRQGLPLTEKQAHEGVTLWTGSTIKHVQILEHELGRYAFDLVILLRETPDDDGFRLDIWPGDDARKGVIAEALARSATDPALQWEIEPANPLYPRTFTPQPDADHQPTEIALSLPGKRTNDQQSEESVDLLLSLFHAARQARASGAI